MSEHKAKLTWKRQTADFQYESYDRSHTITFGGGTVVTASSAPEYLGKAEQVNPEEMLAAALSSCHMLTFLAVAAKSRLTVNHYEDEAVALLAKNAQGKMAITQVVLRPRVEFAEAVDAAKLKALHDKAHHNCFIANSVACAVTVEA